ncbi:Hypothetical predicted protein [Octopus vulgaris]|uniref:Uncharacterized protein n=1 Tax=Octopus vulgaris TaxID=6645 RepID=A0AA36BMV9_OCTVU|nr:Hypothetical predicted protein [Octopus vulgaris]
MKKRSGGGGRRRRRGEKDGEEKVKEDEEEGDEEKCVKDKLNLSFILVVLSFRVDHCRLSQKMFYERLYYSMFAKEKE